MPVDMTGRGRHHAKTSPPPQMQPVQPPTVAANPDTGTAIPADATGGEPDASPFEWECPACDTTQISRPEQGCTNPECPTRQTAPAAAGTSTSTDPTQGPGRPDTLADLADKARGMQGVDPATGAPYPPAPPEPEYRLLEVISPLGADQIFRPPGVHQLDEHSVVTIMPLDADSPWPLIDGIVATPQWMIGSYRETLERDTSPTFEPDERAVIEYGLAALEGQIEKVRTTSYGGQIITEGTLARLRARLARQEE